MEEWIKLVPQIYTIKQDLLCIKPKVHTETLKHYEQDLWWEWDITLERTASQKMVHYVQVGLRRSSAMTRQLFNPLGHRNIKAEKNS